ncbi:MAG: Ku protein [Gemmatimonadaceae bacterium]
MRSVWSGSLAFGLVNIPVRLHSAVRDKERVKFRLLHKTDLSPIRYDRVCEREDEPVDWSDIVKGYEFTKGKFVVVTDDEFKRASIASSKTIEILDFVKADEIDPRYYETPYYLMPDKGGEKSYALLREAMARTATVAMGKITMRTDAVHLAGVRVVEDALVLELMRFASELADVDDYTFPASDVVRPQELKMAEQLVENLLQPFDASRYVDDYHANLMKIIRAKMKGKEIEVPEAEAREETPVIDLMARLKESIEQGKHAPRAPHARARAGHRRTKAAKRPARRRSA